MDPLKTGYSLEHHVEGEPRQLDAPMLRFELSREAEELFHSETWKVEGRVAKTLAKYPNLRVVLLALRSGTRMGEHRAPGQLTLQVLSGEVMLEVREQRVGVGAGQVVTLEEPWPHDVEAIADSVILLTLTWPGK